MVGQGFDAEQIAMEAVRRGEDPIAALIGQMAGAVSVCWENPEGAGVFDSERAAALVEDTAAWLRQHRLVAPLRPRDRVLVWLQDHEGVEAAAGAVRAFLSGEGEHGAMVVDAERVEVVVFDGERPPSAVVRGGGEPR